MELHIFSQKTKYRFTTTTLRLFLVYVAEKNFHRRERGGVKPYTSFFSFQDRRDHGNFWGGLFRCMQRWDFSHTPPVCIQLQQSSSCASTIFRETTMQQCVCVRGGKKSKRNVSVLFLFFLKTIHQDKKWQQHRTAGFFISRSAILDFCSGSKNKKTP